MKITKLGIHFTQKNGDVLVRIWPWARDTSGLYKYYSIVHDRYFTSKRGYKEFLSTTEMVHRAPKVKGYLFEDLLLAWVKINFSGQRVVVLTDIDVNAKSASFWDKVPHYNRQAFQDDIVVLHCDTDDNLLDLTDSIDNSFAVAYGFKNGNLVTWNNILPQALSYKSAKVLFNINP
jgi:hypothetical protein